MSLPARDIRWCAQAARTCRQARHKETCSTGERRGHPIAFGRLVGCTSTGLGTETMPGSRRPSNLFSCR